MHAATQSRQLGHEPVAHSLHTSPAPHGAPPGVGLHAGAHVPVAKMHTAPGQSLALAHVVVPVLVVVVVVLVVPVAPAAPAVVHIGFSKTAWGALTLPFSMALAGLLQRWMRPVATASNARAGTVFN